MISRFFIDRPIFASVLSIVITLAGAIGMFTLPIALYPPISPPVVQVDCAFPGASAEVVAETVATPIEQEVNGVENMMYMSSQCTNDGAYNLTVTFRHGVNLHMAQVMVQNRVNLAIPRLPDSIKQTGVTTRKKSPDILLAMALISPDNSFDQLYLSNYALMKLKEELARVPGVGDVGVFGQRDYSMRIWVDPEKLAARSMTASDVTRAIRRQNLPVATGQIGQPPIPSGQVLQVPLNVHGRLVDAQEFGNLIIKRATSGAVVRIKDIATVELGPINEAVSCSVNGMAAVSLAVFQLPDANALDTADLVKAKITELSQAFPPGMDYQIRYDTTPFIRESIGEVFKTLRDAIILVAAVVLLFLQNWRSAIIPLVAVPVAIIGSFAVLAMLGFSLNNLTLFGLVLAIGIVVDDAIVVVEAVEHHVEHGMSPRDATIQAMDEVSGPVIAIGLVLTAVFVPCAFITGIVGQFFRQFALTIATSTIISAFNSLTLSPALAALLIRPRSAGRHRALPLLFYAVLGAYLGFLWIPDRLDGWIKDSELLRQAIAGGLGFVAGLGIGLILDRILVWFFGVFNAGFRLATAGYTRVVGGLLRASVFSVALYGGLLALTYGIFQTTPMGFIPSQDMGYLLVNVQMPDSTSLERTKEVMNRCEQIARSTPGILHTQANTGQSLLLSATGSNFGSMFCIFAPFDERREPAKHGPAIITKLRKRFAEDVPEALTTVLGPPPVRGIGRAGGFKLMVEDRRGDNTSAELQAQTETLIEAARKIPRLASVMSTFRANVPQFFVNVNRSEAMTKEVAVQDLFDTLRIYLGSIYVNDFNRFGRTWQVIVQADARFRNQVDSVPQLKVRNARGTMVPIGALASIEMTNGPLVLTRYNMYPAAPVNGAAAPGTSSGEAIEEMNSLARDNLPSSMATEWTELAFLELEAGNTAMIVFACAVVMVFLVLAAQYESWSMPLAIILVVPLCLLSGIIGVNIAGEDNNIFTQIGFVVLVGLASKNAILIVEFAKKRRDAGETRRAATLAACSLRLRPIIMTSLAFILGVAPLLYGQGAGSEMRHTLGTTVFSGMLGVTVFGIFLTPVFFSVIDWLGESRVFTHPVVRVVTGVPLTILSLRFLREPIRRFRQPVQTPETPPRPLEVPDLVSDSDPELATVAADHDHTAELVDQK